MSVVLREKQRKVGQILKKNPFFDNDENSWQTHFWPMRDGKRINGVGDDDGRAKLGSRERWQETDPITGDTYTDCLY